MKVKRAMRRIARWHELRFAVGGSLGPHSSIWKVWSNGDDVYAAVRSMAHIEKLSFHQSGICRSAFTNQFGKPSSLEDRAVIKWKRTAIQSQGFGHLSRVVMLGIPTDSLSPQSEPLRKPVTWIKPAPAGAATYIEFAFTKEEELAMQWQLSAKSAPRFIVDCFPLPSGDKFVLLAHYDKAEERNVLVPASHHEERDLMFSTYNPWGTGHPARLSLPTLTKDQQLLIVRELGGYPITKKQLAAFVRPFDTLTRTEVWAHQSGGTAQAANRNRKRPGSPSPPHALKWHSARRKMVCRSPLIS